MHQVQSGVRTRAGRLGPADRVTTVRALLAVVVAVLVVRSWGGPDPVAVVVALATVGLVLDAVDGWVARRTGTVSPFGARFDMEVDAFLILALSAYVAPRLGWWVLVIGAARYLLLAGQRVLPWLRRASPARYWAKVVAATQGIVLTVAAAGVLPDAVMKVALAVALALLAESFGHQARQLWRLREPGDRLVDMSGLRGSVTVLAVVLVWLALVLPDGGDLSADALLRLPVEAVVLVGLALVVPTNVRRVLAVVGGVLLAVVVALKALDLGFHAVLDRKFDPMGDWTYLHAGTGVLQDSLGHTGALLTVIGVIVFAVLLLVGLPWCVLRMTAVAASRRRAATATAGVLGAAWLLSALTGIQLGTGGSIASASAAGLAVDEVGQLRADLHDRSVFAREIATDPMAGRTGLLSALRGKDVLVVFVESYGRVAVQGTTYSPGIDRAVEAGDQRLRSAGFSSRSAFLTSPTFGAASWLAHSTLQSGLWVNSQRRYDQLVRAQRLTLASAFQQAGWRTVSDVPSDTKDWTEGKAFYGFDKFYDSRNVGYKGPKFSYALMPDQYTLAALHNNELTSKAPVLAEVDLVSSHHPWTPLPHMVPWDEVGDGSVFDPMPAQGRTPTDVFRDPSAVKAAYGASIEYSMTALTSFVQQWPDPNLVMVVLGDHQPHSYVSGSSPGHDVPISVIAHDPKVLDRIAGWQWQDGLLPRPDAPVWPMDTFRDRFLNAFS